jgi:hypothetical protein
VAVIFSFLKRNYFFQVRDLKLQGKANEVVTRDLIEKLQNQLKAIQVQVSGDKPSPGAMDRVAKDIKVQCISSKIQDIYECFRKKVCPKRSCV